MMVVWPSFRLRNHTAPLLPHKNVSDPESLTGGHSTFLYDIG